MPVVVVTAIVVGVPVVRSKAVFIVGIVRRVAGAVERRPERRGRTRRTVFGSAPGTPTG